MIIDPKQLIAQVITLERRADRRKLFEPMAKEQGIWYRYHPGATLHPDPKVNINCSHHACVLTAKNLKQPYALIMEDDCWFPAKDGYQHFLRNVPEDFDLYLGGAYGAAEDEQGVTWSFCGMHCYLLHARFYDTFLAVDMFEHIDRALDGKGRYVVCRPYAAIQRNGFSDNVRQNMNYGQMLAGKVYTGA